MEDLYKGPDKNTILNFLTTSEKIFEYPSLQSEAVDLISSTVTNILYDTLKQKDNGSSTRRCNVLKYISNLCKRREFHFDDEFYEFYLEAYKEQLLSSADLGNFINQCSAEITAETSNFNREIELFYARKNNKRKMKMKKLEFIKQKDQENINNFFEMQVIKSFSCYETNKALIKQLISESNYSSDNGGKLISLQQRKEDIKFCCCLLNLNNSQYAIILTSILGKLLGYIKLEKFEIDFLCDLWLSENDVSKVELDFLMKNFSFILEKCIINICKEIVLLESDSEVIQYFADLEFDKRKVKIVMVCLQNAQLRHHLKVLIYEMYIFSYCNKHILRLLTFL